MIRSSFLVDVPNKMMSLRRIRGKAPDGAVRFERFAHLARQHGPGAIGALFARSVMDINRMFGDLLRYRTLLVQLIRRDVVTRYRGAMFGALWMFLSPLLMLGIFAFVFGHIFQARWPQQPDGLPFWLLLYTGLIAFNIFAEAVSRSPTAVRGHPSYVKKIIFPVVILPLVPMGSGLVHGAFNFAILVAALAWVGHLSIGVLLFPILMTPVFLLAAGLAWFFASWGVFIKDMSQVVPLLVQMTLFLSPVFYPASAVPPFLQPIYELNPLGAAIEAGRAAIVGAPVEWAAWSFALAVGVVTAYLGFLVFHRQRDEFADVL